MVQNSFGHTVIVFLLNVPDDLKGRGNKDELSS